MVPLHACDPRVPLQVSAAGEAFVEVRVDARLRHEVGAARARHDAPHRRLRLHVLLTRHGSLLDYGC